MTDSHARPGKRDRLVAAACELVYRQGIARTTLADIALAGDVPVGNVYYYFKTKDDIIGAVVQAHVDQLTSSIAALERRHRGPRPGSRRWWVCWPSGGTCSPGTAARTGR